MIDNLKVFTKNISLNEAFKEFKENADFRNILESGNFRFINNCFVINDIKYTRKDCRGKYILTDYALDFSEECTLLFGCTMESVIVGTDTSLPPNMLGMTEVETEYKKIPFYADEAQNGKIYDLSKALFNVNDEFINFRDTLRSIATANTFWERADQIMTAMKMSKKDFRERSQLDYQTISRTRNQKNDISLRVGITACVALGLDISESEKLLALAKIALNNDEDCIVYRFILKSFNDCSIDECNEVIKLINNENKINVPLLGVQ